MHSRHLLALFTLAFLVSCQQPEGLPNSPAESFEEETPIDIVVEEELTPEEADLAAEEQAKENREVYSAAVEQGDLTLCAEMEGEDLRYSCEQSTLIQIAIQSGDKSKCKDLATDKGRTNCEHEFAQAQMEAANSKPEEVNTAE